jgi:hypothetical protein
MNVAEQFAYSDRYVCADLGTRCGGDRKGPFVDIAFDPRTLVTTGRLQLIVSRPVCELAVEADPQKWSSSPFFESSYKINKRDEGYELDRHSPTPGTSWSGHLFEHFRWNLGAAKLARIINILNIEYVVEQHRIDLRYSLHRPLSGNVWFSPTPIGVDVDHGYFRATETASGIHLDAVKSMRFVELESRANPVSNRRRASDLLNRCAPGALEHWLRQVGLRWEAPPPAESAAAAE